MSRRAKPAKAKVEAKRPLARGVPKKEAARVLELEKRLTETLEQQTATSEILQAIRSSPTDLQPIFDSIVQSAVRLCDGLFAGAFRFDGDLVHLISHHNFTAEGLETAQRAFPMRPRRDNAVGRSVLDRAVVHFPDVEHAPRQILQQALGYRSVLAVPMLRDGQPIGAIAVTYAEAQPFSDAQIALLQTFADQAVIAIENVRLFTELEAKNRALTEAHAQVMETLEQQTATAEILRVISSSPADLQPMLDAVGQNAARLCDASNALILRVDGDVVRLVAQYGALAGPPPEEMTTGQPINRDWVTGRCVVERRTIHVHDLAAEGDEYPYGRVHQQRLGHRTTLATPLLREGVALGAILIRRMEVRPFSDRQIALLETFAAQAVIAIENVRLFNETKEALERQTATSDILRVISSSLTDTQPVFDAIAANAARLCAARDAQVLRVEGDVLRLVSAYGSPSMPPVRSISRGHAVGRAVIDRQTIHVRDMAQAVAEFPETSALLHGVQSILAVPLLRKDVAIGVIRISRTQIQPFTDAQVALLQTFADQAVIAIENVRLFKELEHKTRQVEAASQHKSEFLANMSHELRTPLNAIIGFSEVLSERMFGELNEKQEEYLKDIHASGQHLLSLINDILDLSKVEAGRMELELTDFHLPQAIENALVLVRERALRRGITLEQSIDPRLGEIQGDERKVKQVLLNLLSNAIKFTPEGGRIEVRARPGNELAEIAVSDTGIGIAPEDHEAVFEEFRQVGTAEKRAEGTGLGLALARKFIELHGGRIWVESQVGAGSTFTFTLPVCPSLPT